MVLSYIFIDKFQTICWRVRPSRKSRVLSVNGRLWLVDETTTL